MNGQMAVEDLFLAVSGGFSGFKPIFRQKCGISPQNQRPQFFFALRFFTTLERCIGREKSTSQLEKVKKEIWAF